MITINPPHPATWPAAHAASWPATGRNLLDPDAAAYIAAIEGDGETVTSDQRSALNTFFTTGKAAGWYSSLKRLYLPIWGAASPNARCLVSGTSGTFNGTVTHSAGYIASDGSTGYLDTNIAANAIAGLGNDSAWMGALVKSALENDQYLGCQEGLDVFLLRHTVNPAVVCEILSVIGGRYPTATIVNHGIISGRRLSGTRANMQRLSSGRSVLGSSVDASVGTAPAFNVFVGMKNNAGSPTSGAGSEIGAAWFGSGVSDTKDENFTDALKTLWETCTGLTLP